MSRGPGRLQRRVLERLEATPERKRNRVELDRVLVDEEGFDESNVLRAIRGLAREHRVAFEDRRRKEDSIVALPPEVEPLPEAKVMELLTETGGDA